MAAELASCTALEKFTWNVQNQAAVGLIPTLATTILNIIFEGGPLARIAHDILGDLSQRPTAFTSVRLKGDRTAFYGSQFSDQIL